MNRTTTCLIALATAMLLCAPLAARDVKNLDSAAWQPGKLKLPLTVHERGGVQRKASVVTSGVPFPVGFLKDVSRLGVVDAEGKVVPSQATMTLKWHKPTYDDSVQWALVSFVCDVPANGTARYYLVDNGPAAAQTPMKLAETDAELKIDTGAAQFVIPKQGDALISSATVAGRQVITGKGLRGVITSGEWEDRGLKDGSKHAGRHESVTVEENGPVRTVLAVNGRHLPGDKDGKFYDFTARLYFEAGSPAVRVIYTISNGKLDPKFVDGSRWAYVWPIEDASLVADLALDGADASMLVDSNKVSAATGGDAIRVYQDSSGGDQWQDLPGGNYEKWLTRYTDGKKVRGVTFRGFKAWSGEQEIESGDAAAGVVSAGTTKAGIVAALRNFRVEYPSALAASGKELRVGLFPGEFSEPFHLNMGARKSWDVRIWLNGGGKVEDRDYLAGCFGTHDALLLFRAEPAWMVRAATDSAWPAGLAMVDGPKTPSLRRDTSKLDGINAGWDWYGWISGWNSGGGHWNQNTVFAPWVLWGDGASFDDAESRALWAGDVCALHFDDPSFESFWLMLRSWNLHENRLKVATYPDYYNRDTWGLPDSGHMGMFMWPEYYFLTGDMRAREAVEHLGIRGRAFLWEYNHDDKNDGTGPLPRAINWCKKRDPDADPDFKLATRYVGWPLYDLSQYYRFTGDPQLLAEAKTVARAFRNTARYSPIGFMVLEINAKDSKAVYGGQGPFEPYRSQSASQCYAHFQEGIMTTGLAEYYMMSRDVEALDAMVGFGDLMTHHAMLRDEAGKMQGWTYAFGDYWGPYSWEQAGKNATFFVSNFRVIQPMGWISYFTGRDDFREVLQAALDNQPRTHLDTIATHMAIVHPKVDSSPPAAVTDLKAEALGGGKVKLTWTAVGDDGKTGRASWYQVKFHTGKLVERVEGWPDRSEPLPTDKKEWEAKAAAFNAKQRSFWSSQNVTGDAPAPADAGKTVTMVVENLPAGTVNLAVKAWDDAENLSPLSNVVQVDVKE